MKKNNLPLFEVAALIIGEALVSLAVIIIFILLKKFSYQVVFGTLLGTAVTLINFAILSATANRAIDRAMQNRPEGELDEDEAAEFASKNQNQLQNAMRVSYLIRTATMVATLVLAFLLKDVFHVIATVIPLIAFQPIIAVSTILKRRVGK